MASPQSLEEFISMFPSRKDSEDLFLRTLSLISSLLDASKGPYPQLFVLTLEAPPVAIRLTPTLSFYSPFGQCPL